MYVYLDMVVFLNFTVDLLIILGTNCLTGYPLGTGKAALSAAVGAVYAGVCMLPGFYFLGSILWRMICLSIMSFIAFGWNRSLIQRGTVFAFISMALGGVALAIGSGGLVGVILSAAVIFAMCCLGFGKRIGSAEYVPVDLYLDGKHVRLTALKDTGNSLTDPLSGQSVLVVGPEVATDLLGIKPDDLIDPIATMQRNINPRMRLIPYRTVGQATGMLLAVRFDEVRIKGINSGQVVAFSPNSFGSGAQYQALTGGIT